MATRTFKFTCMAHVIPDLLHPYEILLAHDNKITSSLWRWELNLQYSIACARVQFIQRWKQTVKIWIEKNRALFSLLEIIWHVRRPFLHTLTLLEAFDAHSVRFHIWSLGVTSSVKSQIKIKKSWKVLCCSWRICPIGW